MPDLSRCVCGTGRVRKVHPATLPCCVAVRAGLKTALGVPSREAAHVSGDWQCVRLTKPLTYTRTIGPRTLLGRAALARRGRD